MRRSGYKVQGFMVHTRTTSLRAERCLAWTLAPSARSQTLDALDPANPPSATSRKGGDRVVHRLCGDRGGVILLDPVVSRRIPAQPYPMRLVWYAANLVIPLGLTFAMLRYTDLRRRRAEARSEQLLTNAIPVSIAARLKRGARSGVPLELRVGCQRAGGGRHHWETAHPLRPLGRHGQHCGP
jgi:hypothetical protein